MNSLRDRQTLALAGLMAALWLARRASACVCRSLREICAACVQYTGGMAAPDSALCVYFSVSKYSFARSRSTEIGWYSRHPSASVFLKRTTFFSGSTW